MVFGFGALGFEVQGFACLSAGTESCAKAFPACGVHCNGVKALSAP